MYGFNIFSGDDWMWLFNTILLAPMVGLCYIVYFLESAFYTLAVGFQDKDGNQINLVEVIMSKDCEPIQKILAIGAGVALAFLLFFIVIRVLKIYLTGRLNEESDPKQAVAGGVKGLMTMVIVPLIAIIAVLIINKFTFEVARYLNPSMGTNPASSIANTIFLQLGKWKNLPSGFWFGSVGVGEIVSKYYFDSTDITNYQYIVGYFAAFVLLFNLGKAAMISGKRIFDIGTLYVIQPYTSSVYPLDDGKRVRVWISLFISKLLSALAMIFAFYIYLAIMQSMKEALGVTGTFIDFSKPQDAQNIKNICFIIIVITGAMATSGTPALIGRIISQEAGADAESDARAIEGDIRWGTAMTGRVFGTATGLAKDLLGASGALGGGTGKGALASGSVLGSIGSKVLHPINSAKAGIQAGRTNKLNDLRNQLAKNYGSSNKADIKAFNSAQKKYQRMTGSKFGADQALDIAKRNQSLSSSGIKDNWSAKEALKKAKDADKAARKLGK